MQWTKICVVLVICTGLFCTLVACFEILHGISALWIISRTLIRCLPLEKPHLTFCSLYVLVQSAKFLVSPEIYHHQVELVFLTDSDCLQMPSSLASWVKEWSPSNWVFMIRRLFPVFLIFNRYETSLWCSLPVFSEH